MKVVLFDLDGTIINSQAGVTNCVKYALESTGITEVDMTILRKFIGPPLLNSFQKYYGFSEEKADELVKKYRERYQKTGIFECELYTDVESTLKNLKQKGYVIGLASSKPEEFCKQILEYFHIDTYFDEVVGAQLNGPRNEKADVLKEALERLKVINLSQVTLVGDTKFDAIGAKQAGISCIGVSYGFGNRSELIENEVVALVDSMKEVDDYFEE